jgi:hypothetical protein
MTRHRDERIAREERDRIADLYQKAQGLYNMMTDLTETPQDGAEVVCFMHMLLYLNYGASNTNVDTMLEQYIKNFKLNYEAQVEANKRTAN